MENIWEKQFPQSDLKDMPIFKLLGEEDGNTEWKHSPEETDNIFLHTNTYEAFKEPHFLYLFGRRGTGKSSILRKMSYEIRKGGFNKYISCCIINKDRFLNSMTSNFRSNNIVNYNENELIQVFKDHWNCIITTSAMRAIHKSYGSKKAHDGNLKEIHKYLFNNNLLREGSLLQKIQKIFKSCFEEGGSTVVNIIHKLSKELFPDGYFDAKNALTNILKENNGYCLIMLDTIEKYDIKDKISQAAITGLIEAVKIFYDNLNKNYILSKVAFPSEIYSYIRFLNPGKTEGNTLFIRWSYKDFICFIAKRFLNKLDNYNGGQDNLLDDYTKAKQYLNKYLPNEITTSNGIILNTMAYIIRHTQKTPRQLIEIFNVILSLVKDKGLTYNNLDNEIIKIGVHARLDTLINESLTVYNMIYEDSKIIVEKILSGEKNIFKGKYLDKIVRKASGILGRNQLSNDEAKRLLLECGAIGIIVSKNKLSIQGKYIYETLFVYQVKEFFISPDEFDCAIHPMMYQELFNETHKHCLIYPKPYEDEEKEELAHMGIMLI